MGGAQPVVDLSQAFQTLLQTVPIWAFVGIAVNYWIKKSTDKADEFQKRLMAIEKAILQIQLKLKIKGAEDDE